MVASLKVRLVHISANNIIRLFFFFGDAVHRLICLFFLVVVVLGLIFIGRGRDDRESNAIMSDVLNLAVRNKLVVFEFWGSFFYGIDYFDLRSWDGLMFVGFFPVDVEPFGVKREFQFMFCYFRGFVVVERVTVFVPCAGV